MTTLEINEPEAEGEIDLRERAFEMTFDRIANRIMGARLNVPAIAQAEVPILKEMLKEAFDAGRKAEREG